MADAPASESTRRGPGRPRSIDVDQIVDAGLAVGLDRLTLAAVADELGVHAGSLYRYISGRDELAQLVADRIFDAADFDDDPTLSQEELLTELACQLRRVLVDNPGTTAYALSAGVTPGIQRFREKYVVLLVDRGLELTKAVLLLDETAGYAIAWANVGDPTNRSLHFKRHGQLEPSELIQQAHEGYQPASDDEWFRWCVSAHIRGTMAALADDHFPWS